jgi:hypothetical protein
MSMCQAPDCVNTFDETIEPITHRYCEECRCQNCDSERIEYRYMGVFGVDHCIHCGLVTVDNIPAFYSDNSETDFKGGVIL